MYCNVFWVLDKIVFTINTLKWEYITKIKVYWFFIVADPHIAMGIYTVSNK